jgi:hypothetical protein
MPQTHESKSLGVTKPVGNVLAAFKTETDARAAIAALSDAGFAGDDVVFYSAEQMRARTSNDIDEANFLAALGQDLNLVKAHRDLAVQGHCFVSVRAPSDDEARLVAGIVERQHAVRAQKYGRLITEELIEPGTGEQQVAESPARGLDAQTPSGREGDTRDG